MADSPMSAEMIAAMMEAGMMDPKMDQLSQQMAQASQLRNMRSGQGGGHSLAGGLAGIGANIMGGLQEHSIRGDQSKLMDQNVQAKKLFLDRLLAGQGAPQAPKAAPQPMPSPLDESI